MDSMLWSKMNQTQTLYMASWSFLVDGGRMCFYRVLSVDVRAQAEDPYQNVYVDKIWPRTNQPTFYGSSQPRS